MLACQMSQSEEGMARIEAMCLHICFAIEIEHTVCEYVGGLH